MIEGSPVTIPTNSQCATFLAVVLFAVNVANATDDDAAPRASDPAAERIPLQTLAPQYPPLARQMRLEGEVTVCFNVDRGGKPHRVKVRSSSNRIFEKPAKKAVRGSSYQPLNKDQKETGIKSCRTFRFSLPPVETPEN
jgi:TonB family protein